MEAMLPYLRTHLDVVDDLLTPGIPRNKVYSTWPDGETGALKNKFQAL